MEVLIPLAVAAQQLRRTPDATRRMVTTGQLDGELRGGRWLVTRESLERLASEPAPAPEAAAAS